MTRILLYFVASALWAQQGPLDLAFDRLYRHDFSGAHAILKDYTSRNPSDPVGHSVVSAAHLFSELDRLHILESEFFGDDDRILSRKKLKPDPGVRAQLFQAIGKVRQIAGSGPQDIQALFALCIATGVQTDYVALVEKRQMGSLSLAKESQSWAVRLLKADPKFYDAYITTGISEYLLGSVPFFVRWFVKFEQAQGSKTQAVRNLELVAANGRYFRPFAKVLLAIIHLREKRLPEAERQLRELNQEFPENPLFRRELEKVRRRSAN
ncbi:MAG TPA: hypothetical protein VM120_09825 [Bryobacteraceae bacterium]|nr:hypothetical protein [Bryobacteraceae bacterium]